MVFILTLGKLERQIIMATEKTFTVAGVASQNGVTKVRFANDLVARVKILDKAGCTDIDLVELPEAMTKLEALRFMQTQERFQSGDAAYVIANKVAEKVREAKKKELSVPYTRKEKVTEPELA